MLRRWKRLWSLANFSRRGVTPQGQIATFMLLVIGALLIFTLMTANLGSRALTTTTVANAADTASLFLASQLATKSYQLADALSGSSNDGSLALKKCKKGGLFGFILGIILAIVFIVVFAPLLGPVLGPVGANVVAGAAGGAAGGAIGNAVIGLDPLAGALQGAMIGAAIGGAVNIALGPASDAAMNAAWSAYGQAHGGMAGFYAAMGAYQATLPGALAAASTATVGLAAGSGLYTAHVQEQMQANAIAAAVKTLNGAPEDLRIQQGVIFQALSQVVDDPTEVPDAHDIDGDGFHSSDRIPNFINWWHEHIEDLEDKIPALMNLMNNFRNNVLFPLKDYLLPETYGGGDPVIGITQHFDYWHDCPGFYCTEVGYLAAPWDPDLELPGGSIDGGKLFEIFKLIEVDGGYNLPFWEDGPTKEQYALWLAGDPDEENLPPGWDEVDEAVSEFKDYIDTINEVAAISAQQGTVTWATWFPWFHDEPIPGEPPADFFHTFETLINGDAEWGIKGIKGPNGWVAKLAHVRDHPEIFPPCQFSGFIPPFFILYGPPPCQLSGGGLQLDWWPDPDTDTLDALINQLDDPVSTDPPPNPGLVQRLQQWMNAVEDTVDARNEILSEVAGGFNPVVYPGINEDGSPQVWSDTRGDHFVQVEVGPFRLPRTYKKKSGGFCKKKICIKRADYCDGFAACEFNTGRTWVEITRMDSAAGQRLWTWNSSNNANNSARITRKKSRAKYSYNQVGLAGIQ